MAKVCLTMAMVALLGLVLTAQTGLAKATTKSSYKIGLKWGYIDWHNILNPDQNGLPGDREYPKECLLNPNVDNLTACMDGYVHAWMSSCHPSPGTQGCRYITPEGKTIYSNPNAPALMAACKAAGHDWVSGFCSTQSKLVASSGPMHCYNDTNTGYTCEAGIGTIGNGGSKGNATGNMTTTTTVPHITSATNETQPHNVGSTFSNVTGNATGLNGTSENGNETSSNTNETQPQPQQQQPYNATEQLQNLLQQLPQIIQLNNGSIIVNGTVHTETNCSRTDLTQDERYPYGYNHGYKDAQTDWNLHRFPPDSGGDNSCPHATEHTPEYCKGYAKGYTYEWNTLYQRQQTPS